MGAAHGAKKKYEKWRKDEEEEKTDKSHSGRLRRFFNHKHEKKSDAHEESYVHM